MTNDARMPASSKGFNDNFQMFAHHFHRFCNIFLFCLVVSTCQGAETGTLFQDCGGVYEASKGVIYTPNFPDAYPTPIYCEWLIHAPPDKKIILYFTQFYMKDSFYLTEYDAYQDTSTYIGRHDLGRIASWQHDLLSLAAYKPYVLIQFSVESIGNRHLRVMDSLLDVYGFNITYEIVDRSTDVTKNTCSVKECSYLGNCIVSHDFSEFRCECFEGFFGNQCQYGPYCDPDADPPINQCSNEGRCKYFFGSMINQCECLQGFYGAHCETASGSDAELDQECQALKCSQLCDHIDGRATCLCHDGYKMDIDNGTCIPIARYRMDVTLKLASFIHVPDSEYERKIDRAKQLIAKAIEENGVSTISKFGIKGLRNSTITTLLEFYFYCKVSEVEFVDQALRAVVSLGTIGSFTLMNTTATYVQSPELHLGEVQNYDPSPALQGKLLTLVCAARGSADMTFHWYKDGFKVETELTQRQAWETKIPHTVQGMQLSVLNIDNVTPFDAGMFTCEVQDFGDVQHKHVMVDVKGYPQVDLGPMSASIPKGQQVSMKCISPDDGWQQFVYDWFKNGVKIPPDSRTEYAEDMYPTGVRLVVSTVTSYAEYTCKVTNEAGSANVTAYIYAITENETGLYCPKNYEGNVMWQQTSGGHFDIQRCPTEQGVTSPFFAGYARRKCQCEAGASRTDQCAWTIPNFAKCQSLFLIKIYDELEALRLGYQQTTLKKVFEHLYRYVLPSKSTILYSGDIDMVAGILKELLVHMKNFPQLVLKDDKISGLKLTQLMSEILTRLAAATSEEKELMLGGASIIRMTNVLFTEAGRSLNFTRNERLTSDAIEMYIDHYLEVPVPDKFKVSEPTKHVKTLTERSVVTEAVYNTPIDVLVITMKQLTDLLFYKNKIHGDGKDAAKSPFPATVSAVHSVAPYVGSNITYATPYVEVTINHVSKMNLGGPNTTVCLTWSVDSSNQYQGSWSKDRCITVYSTSTYTTCNCRIPAHIVVALGKRNSSIEEIDLTYEDLDTVLLVSYTLSMAIMFVTLYIYLRTCGQLKRKMYSNHLSFIFCLFLSNGIVLLCILQKQIKIDLTVLSRMSLHFLYTIEFSFLLIEMVHIYALIQDIQKLQLSSIKCMLLGWGSSIFLIVVVIITSGSLGHDSSCNKICWLSWDHWQMHSFIVPVGLFVLSYVILMGLCVWQLRQWKEEWRYVEKKIHMKSIAKSSSILLLLLVSCLLAVNLSSSRGQKFAHAFFHISLVVVVFLGRCIFDKHIRFILKRTFFGTFTRDPALKSVRSSGSFRAFIKPEKVANTVVSQEEYSVSRYYDEVNRTKYTNERKKQLSFLLGSSSGGSGGSNSTGDTKSTNVSGSTRDSDIASIKPSKGDETVGQDSGIFVNNSEEESDPVKPTPDKTIRDTDIHTSIFTDPLAACRKTETDASEDASPNNHDTDSKCRDDKRFTSHKVKEPAKSSGLLQNSKGAVNSMSRNTEKTLEKNGHSPRTKLKGRLQEVCSASCEGKGRNGYNRNPESKLNTVVIAREGDLDAIDECSVLVHNSGGVKIAGETGASSCNSKLLSSSLESHNDSSVSLD